MVVKETHLGKGLFASRHVAKGEYVGEIKGRLVRDLDPAYNYYIDYSDTHVLDPHPPFRFVNHSCEPNCQFTIEEWEENGQVERAVFLEALEDIIPGNELCTDYAWPSRETIPCQCGSPSCRGWIISKEEVDYLQ